MFTQGRIAFLVFFVVAFAIILIWSYWKEKKIIKEHFEKPYKVLVAILLLLLAQFIIVKIRKFF